MSAPEQRPSAENDVPPCPVCGGNIRFCECMDDPFAHVPDSAENDALTERAEAALDAYFIGRIESEEQEPSSFGPRVLSPEGSDR